MIARYNGIWKLDKSKLQELLDTSNTIAEVLVKIGISLHGNNYKELKNRVIKESLSLELLNGNRKVKSSGGYKTSSTNDIFTESSAISRSTVKKRLIKENLIEYKCSMCCNKGKWNNQELVLQLDHINGINTDNRIENLRFLCPNCHTQTDTFTGRNSKKEITKTTQVSNNKPIKVKVKKPRPLKFEVTKEKLEELVKNNPMTSIGKMFGVSNNAIKKRCIKLGIDYKNK
jgi:hypothetical protein